MRYPLTMPMAPECAEMLVFPSRAKPALFHVLVSVPVQVLAAGLLPISTLTASPQLCPGAVRRLALGGAARGLAERFPIKLFRKRSPIPVH